MKNCRRLQKAALTAGLFILLFARTALAGPGSDYKVSVPEFPMPPKIDGELDNPIWERGAILEKFTQFEPQEGKLPTEKTVGYIGHDQDNLYIGFRCFDSDPKAIRASLSQRDMVRGDDGIMVYLDTFNDKKRAFVFEVNPCGIQSDGTFTESGGGRGRGRGGGGGGGFDRVDRSWDTYFLAHATIDEQGYQVEMAIPFKSLRFPNKNTQVWGLQIMRTIRRKNEEIFWYPRSRDVNGFLVQSGQIEIPGRIKKGRNLEVMPVVTGLKQDSAALKPEAGLNVKYGITSDLTADAALNPDFSQVEADMPQIDVNQRYALYYPEKRPFFLEGKDFFDTPLEVVYTRKVVDPLWGVKLSGKVGKTTLAFMSSLDENAPGIDISGMDEDEDGDGEEETGERYRSLVNVFRLRQDVFSESYIGLIFTDKERGLSLDNLTAEYNRVAGVDGHLKFLNNYRFSFQVLGSASKAGEIRTGLQPAWAFNLSRSSRHLNLSLDWTSIDPEFEAAAGFFRRKDIQALSSRLGYSFLPQNDILISLTPSFEYRRSYDFQQTLTDEEYTLGVFLNGWRQSHIWINFSSGLERYEGKNFRGQEFRANFSSEPLSWLSGNVSFNLGDGIYYSNDPYQGWKTGLGVRLTLRPLTNLRFFFNFQNDVFFKERGGEKEYNINIYSLRTSYQLSKPLSVRLITDYNDYYGKIYLSFLVSYEYRPGTVFYFGLDDNQEKDESGIFRGQGRYVFLKFSYWWRV